MEWAELHMAQGRTGQSAYSIWMCSDGARVGDLRTWGTDFNEGGKEFSKKVAVTKARKVYGI